jgi:hypothetical protein
MALIMPDGKVLVLGGSTTDPRYSAGMDRDAVLVPEEFDPVRNEWKSLPASPIVPRVYHSVALLLPDGRVWTAGSNHDSDLGDTARELRIELFEPWYFDKVRPEITVLPDSIGYGQTFTVATRQADSIIRIAVIRAGSTTHGFNSDQRYVGLRFVNRGMDRLSVIAPPNGNIAPPGYYMLFLIDRNGVPSKAKFLRVRSRRSLVRSISTTEGGTSLFVIGIDGKVWSTFFDPRQQNPSWQPWFAIHDNVFPHNSAIVS